MENKKEIKIEILLSDRWDPFKKMHVAVYFSTETCWLQGMLERKAHA